jgi:hypothetical protein
MSDEDPKSAPLEPGDVVTLGGTGDPYGSGSGHDLINPNAADADSVEWMEGTASPFGVPLLDCRLFARSQTSVSSNPEMATGFLKLRSADPRDLIQQSIEDEVVQEVGLIYPALLPSPNGVLFRAEAMEDKWDIYLVEGQAYFFRSWSGLPIYRASLDLTAVGWVLRDIAGPRRVEDSAEGMSLRMIDFLLRSHAFGCVLPHPVPADTPDDPQSVLHWSFSEFGRWGSYATRADTLFLGPLAPAQSDPERFGLDAGDSTET